MLIRLVIAEITEISPGRHIENQCAQAVSPRLCFWIRWSECCNRTAQFEYISRIIDVHNIFRICHAFTIDTTGDGFRGAVKSIVLTLTFNAHLETALYDTCSSRRERINAFAVRNLQGRACRRDVLTVLTKTIVSPHAKLWRCFSSGRNSEKRINAGRLRKKHKQKRCAQ